MKQLDFTKDFVNQSKTYLLELGLSEDEVKTVFVVLTTIILLSLGWLLNRVLDRIIQWISSIVIKRLKPEQLLTSALERKVSQPLYRIIVANILKYLFIAFYGIEGPIIKIFLILFDLYIVYFVVIFVSRIIFAIRDWAYLKPEMQGKPLDSLAQIANIFNYLLGIFMSYSAITGNSIDHLLTVLGAASAVLILVFRDPIMGFVSSIQLSTHDMVKIGDWISVKDFKADGTVLEIGVTSVKVRNWDKTITTVPTSALVSGAFINWKGMQESGGRRIKRALIIRQTSIRFLKPAEIEKLEPISLLSDYLKSSNKEIVAYNTKNKIDKSIPLNGRNLTNFGVFRKYAQLYVESQNTIRKDYTVMTRQLDPTERGIPLQIYAFTDTIHWVEHEEIMSDIFDHLISAVPYFDLEIFELPSGSDFRYFSEEFNEEEETKAKNTNNLIPGIEN